MHVKIITVGSKSPKAINSLILNYEKRLPRHIQVSWQYLKHGASGDTSISKHQESENILKALPKTGTVILLDEKGKQLTNKKLAIKLFEDPRGVAIIIGGAHGVSETVMKRADFIWSLSELVLPHNIVRLLLAEQIYRSYTITINHPYHHN